MGHTVDVKTPALRGARPGTEHVVAVGGSDGNSDCRTCCENKSVIYLNRSQHVGPVGGGSAVSAGGILQASVFSSGGDARGDVWDGEDVRDDVRGVGGVRDFGVHGVGSVGGVGGVGGPVLPVPLQPLSS